MTWLNKVGFVPLLDEELLKIQHSLSDQIDRLNSLGYLAQAEGYRSLLAKLSGMHGRDYKISPLTDADRETIKC